MKSGLLLVALCSCVLLAGCGGSNKPAVSASATGRLASTSIPLGSAMISVLGKIEGPYKLDKVLSPSRLQLTPAKGDPIQVTMLGLLDGNYPEPPVKDDKRTAEQIKADQQKFVEYKMDEMGKLLKNRTLYLLRMGLGDENTPPQVYVFYTIHDIKDITRPKMDGELVNAWVLRRGIAQIDFEAPEHPFRELMFECAAVSLLETRQAVKKGRSSSTIWARADVQFPAQYEPQVAVIEKRM